MTTTGKSMAVVIIIVLLVIAGIAYYFYDRNETMEYGQDLGANSLSEDSTALSKDQIQKESFDDSLNGLEADLDSESASDYYDENTYVTQSDSSSDLVLTY